MLCLSSSIMQLGKAVQSEALHCRHKRRVAAMLRVRCMHRLFAFWNALHKPVLGSWSIIKLAGLNDCGTVTCVNAGQRRPLCSALCIWRDCYR